MPEQSTPATDSGAGTEVPNALDTSDDDGAQDNPASEPGTTDTGVVEEPSTTDQADDDTGATDPDGSVDQPDDDGKPDREAAKYRRERNQARAEVERLTGIVETFQRTEVERLAASRLIDGRDVWAGGLSLGDMLADDGTVDPAKVSSAAAEIAASRRHWAKSPAAPASSVTGNHKPGGPGDDDKPTWGKLFERVRNGVTAEDH